MVSKEDRGLNAEQLYKQLSKYPYRAILVPALKVGILTGGTGLLTGGVGALLRSSPTPTLFTIASSLQWFALGSMFTTTRSTLLWHWDIPFPTPQDRITASSYAGGITGGAAGALFRGPRNVLPGALMFTLFGYLGQTAYNKLDARHSKQVAAQREQEKEERKGFWARVAEMKWSPVKKLSDEEYGNILKEKLLRIEAEIALVDEEVESLRGEEKAIRVTEENDAGVKQTEESR